MTKKEQYCQGRAEYLQETTGCALSEGYRIAEREWELIVNTPVRLSY